MIIDGSRRSYLEWHYPILFQLPVPYVGLNGDSCDLSYLHAVAISYSKSGAQTSEHAEYGAGMSNLSFPPAGRLIRDGDSRPLLEPRGESLGLDRMVRDSNGLSPDARLSKGNISDLGLIKTRMANIGTRVANIGNCLKYFQYLLKTIEAIFSSPQGNANIAFDRNVGSNLTNLIFMKAGRSAPNISGSAIGISEYLPKSKLLSTDTTMSNAYRSSLTNNIDDPKHNSNTEQQKSRDTRSLKTIIKDFLIEIFSQVYIYILIVAVSIFSIYVRSTI